LKPRNPLPSALYLLPIAFLGVFFFYPLAAVVAESFAPGGRLNLAPVASLWREPYFGRALWFTCWQAVLSTAVTLALGMPAAFIFARYRFPGKSLIRALTTIPFVMPAMVVAAAFTALLGPRGWLNTQLMAWLDLSRAPIRLQQTIWLILLAHAFYNTTVVVRMVGGFWANLDPRLSEAARVLGGNRLRVFREVTLPLLLPAVGAAALLVFLFCFTSFGVILILGGPGFATLEVEIYRQTAQVLNLPVAAVLTVLQLTAVVALLAVYGRLSRAPERALALRATGEVRRRATTWRARAFVGANLALIAGLLWLPLAVLVERSFAAGGGLSYGLRSYAALFEPARGGALFVAPVEALRNSLLFAAAATVIAIALGMLASAVVAYRRDRVGRAFDTLLMLPLGTSAVIVGFGFILALDKPPLDIRTSIVLIPIAHALVALPFVVRAMAPVIRSIDPRLREAAAVLGASPRRVWQEVDAPLVARAALVGAGFAFAISLGEFGATLFIARPDTPTVPIAIDRLLSHPGVLNFAQAMAMSTILMALSVASMLIIERWRTPGSQAF
jgi:thiamine transport system permease protein